MSERVYNARLTALQPVTLGEGEDGQQPSGVDNPTPPGTLNFPPPLTSSSPTASPETSTPVPTPDETQPATDAEVMETEGLILEETPEATATLELTAAPTLTPAPVSASTGSLVLSWWSTFIWMVLCLALALGWILTAVIGRARRASKITTAAPMDRRGRKPVGISVGNLHNIGKRGNQEDSFAISDLSNQELRERHGLLAVVADGMGGLEDGEKASSAVTSTFMNAFAELPDTLTPPQKLLWLTRLANSEVCRVGCGAVGQSGSTLLAVLVHDDRLWFSSVGDSRICLFRGGAQIQLTREHNYAVELDLRAAAGALTFAEATGDGQRHALTSYMGMYEPDHIDFSENPIQLLAGDWVVLMSDGVFNTLGEEEMAALLTGNVHEAAARIENAVLQKQAAYQDNFTAVLLKMS